MRLRYTGQLCEEKRRTLLCESQEIHKHAVPCLISKPIYSEAYESTAMGRRIENRDVTMPWPCPALERFRGQRVSASTMWRSTRLFLLPSCSVKNCSVIFSIRSSDCFTYPSICHHLFPGARVEFSYWRPSNFSDLLYVFPTSFTQVSSCWEADISSTNWQMLINLSDPPVS